MLACGELPILKELSSLHGWVLRQRRVVVNGVTFGTILEQFGTPYYLKVDIEGNDILCLEGLVQAKVAPKHVSIESTKISWRDLLREFSLLKDLGYNKFKVIQQLDVPKQNCKQPSQEGIYSEHKFEPGSTGQFGNDAPGCWLTEEEAIKKYQMIFRDYKYFGDNGLLYKTRVGRGLSRLLKVRVGWYDTHATRA